MIIRNKNNSFTLLVCMVWDNFAHGITGTCNCGLPFYGLSVFASHHFFKCRAYLLLALLFSVLFCLFSSVLEITPVMKRWLGRSENYGGR